MNSDENPFAGQGPVLLDIGGDIGALVVMMPANTAGLEVEIRPSGATHHDHAHHHDHDAATHHPHVAVVARPGGSGAVHSLVYPGVLEGDYDLVPIPGGEVTLSVHVEGGVVTEVTWPG